MLSCPFHFRGSSVCRSTLRRIKPKPIQLGLYCVDEHISVFLIEEQDRHERAAHYTNEGGPLCQGESVAVGQNVLLKNIMSEGAQLDDFYRS